MTPGVSRGKAWAMVLLSGVFVLAGLFVMIVVGDVGAGLAGIAFFGACGLVGLVQLVSLSRGGTGQPSSPAGLLAMAVGSFLLGVGCLVMALVAVLSPESMASWRSPLLAVVIGAVGTVFFGAGSGLLTVRAISLAVRR